MSAIRIAIGFAVLMSASCQQAGPPPRAAYPACGNAFNRPLAADRSTVLAIASAIVAEHQKTNLLDGEFDLALEDGGDHWVAFQSIPPAEHADGSVLVTHGGGGLAMHIAKCDGAVSSVFIQR